MWVNPNTWSIFGFWFEQTPTVKIFYELVREVGLLTGYLIILRNYGDFRGDHGIVVLFL